MSVRRDYAHSRGIMFTHGFYTRSRRCMLVREELCSLTGIYAHPKKFYAFKAQHAFFTAQTREE
jgi:hypothetical protein